MGDYQCIVGVEKPALETHMLSMGLQIGSTFMSGNYRVINAPAIWHKNLRDFYLLSKISEPTSVIQSQVFGIAKIQK